MKIDINTIEQLVKSQGEDGEWRKLINEEYVEGLPYFEFGVYPLKNNNNTESYDLVMNHGFRICIGNYHFSGSRVYISTVQEPRGRRTYLVDDNTLQVFLDECREISNLYTFKNGYPFWSIPNKWFADTKLVAFLSTTFVGVPLPYERNSWFYP